MHRVNHLIFNYFLSKRKSVQINLLSNLSLTKVNDKILMAVIKNVINSVNMIYVKLLKNNDTIYFIVPLMTSLPHCNCPIQELKLFLIYNSPF